MRKKKLDSKLTGYLFVQEHKFTLIFHSNFTINQAATRKVVKTKKKKYLVKWRGLTYRECTWETAKDINDNAKITEYHQLNDSPPDEPPLTQAEIGLELAKDRFIT